MIRGTIKILALVVVVAVLAIPAVALLVDDETLSSSLEEIPVLGKYTEDILRKKQGISMALAGYVGDTLAGLETVYYDILGFSSSPSPGVTKVVIELPAQPPGTPSKPKAPPPPVEPDKIMGAITPSPPPMAPAPAAEKAAPAKKIPAPPASKAKPKPKIAAKKPTAKKPAVKPPKPVTPKKVAKLPAAKKPPTRKDPTADQDHKRGLLFYKGIGVDKDFKKAAQWFRRAANKSHAGAQYNLGIMSYLGQGVEQDFAKAALWFQRAGEQDHAPAQYNLGFLYYEGKGVDKDSLQAFMWIDRAANLGDEKAIRARETLQKALPKEIFSQ